MDQTQKTHKQREQQQTMNQQQQNHPLERTVDEALGCLKYV